MMLRVFCLFAFILLSLSATAQTRPAVKPPEGKIPDKFPTDADQEGGPPWDMRAKMAIARAEGEHKKVLEDVEKLSNLSGEIARGYGERKQLSADDMRKLGTIEKLAKRVLTSAGGEEVDQKPDTDERMPLADAIDKLSATAANIKKEVTAETRFVVSATVIANSNEVISLARFIRRQKAD